METAFSVIWFAAAGGGIVAALVGALFRNRRRPSLVLASGLFAIAGVLGILSIGILFLMLAAACGVAAGRPDIA